MVSTSDFKKLHFDVLDSTNTYAINNITTLDHHTVITADIQTAGRGRMERPWVSDTAENLYASIVIRPEIDFRTLPLVNFTQLFSVIVAQTAAGYGVQPQIKWPNDILVRGSKLCGILSETAFRGGTFTGLVVGIGLNVNHSAEGKVDSSYPTTSLQDETGKFIEKKEVLDRILRAYQNSYEGFITEGFPYIINSYKEFFPFIGEDVSIINSNNNISGRILDVSDSGELIVQDNSGRTHKITLGDMIWKTCQ